MTSFTAPTLHKTLLGRDDMGRACSTH